MSLQVSVDKWMNISNLRYVIASRYNIVLVCLLLKQNMMIFPLKSKHPIEINMHRVICIEYVYDSHFVQIFSKTCGQGLFSYLQLLIHYIILSNKLV